MEQKINKKNISFVFFGGEPLAVPVLETLYENGYIPELIVCNPDKPKGRHLEITPPPTKLWAQAHDIKILQPESLRNGSATKELSDKKYDVFIVVSYGKIIPQEVLDLPSKGTLNVHPSLLPLYRGPAPIIAPILNGDTKTGVTIILLDSDMDHGPILAQEELLLQGNESAEELESSLVKIGGRLLAETLPKWVAGSLTPQEQEHTEATYVKKIIKEDGLITLDEDPIILSRKYRAYTPWPGIYFFHTTKENTQMRVKIKQAIATKDSFSIERVIPEGRKEISWEEFKRSY